MKNNGKTLLIIIAIICAVLSGIIYLNRRSEEQEWLTSLSYEKPDEIFENKNDKVNSTIKVYITGEVISPGVYEVEEGCRVNDVIEMAGGATEDADLESLNLAAYVKDAEKIVIPDISKEVDKPDSPIQNKSELININTATLEELKTLPGVGDVTAKNIISYREKNGGFKSIEEIKNVPRIGDKTFLQLMDYISV